jgi:hypothetical protein
MNIQSGGDRSCSGFAETFLAEQGCRSIQHQFRRWAGRNSALTRGTHGGGVAAIR